MAVLIEGISVVIKISSILKIYNNDVEEFDESVPNKQYCADNELFRVGFMHPYDVENYIKFLGSKGFVYLKDDMSIDLVVIDQKEGLMANCNWVEFYNYEVKETKHVIGCRLKGGIEENLYKPNLWSYDNSLYTSGNKFLTDEMNEKLTFIEKNNKVDKYMENETGEIIYIGRTN
jgi:hypothetical protein